MKFKNQLSKSIFLNCYKGNGSPVGIKVKTDKDVIDIPKGTIFMTVSQYDHSKV